MRAIDAQERGRTPEELLRAVPFFRELDRVDIARLAGGLEQLRVAKGQVLFREGEPADGLYLVDDGALTLTIRSGEDVEVGAVRSGDFFGELGLLLARRTATASAVADSVLWRLPREPFEDLVRERAEVGLAVATAVAERLEQRQRDLIGAPKPEVEARPLTIERRRERRDPRQRILGAALAFAVPLALWQLAPPPHLTVAAWHVILVLLGAAIAWLFEPVPDFVVAIALAAAWGITGAAPISDVFGGFATPTWVLAFAGLVLVAAMSRSGLLYRAGLFLLRAFPATHAGQMLALVVGGIFLTPFVPQSVARVAAIGPVTAELRTALGQPVRSSGAAGLAFAGLVGHWYFSNLFLTGFATNFFILELIPATERERFGWSGWATASSVTLIVCALLATAALFVMFKPTPARRPSAETLYRQLRVIGGLSSAEILTAVAVLVLVIGLLAQPLLRVDGAWLGAIALAIAAGGVLGREAFRTGVDWAFLVLLGVLLGSGAVLQRQGIDRWLFATLEPLAQGAHPGLVVVGLAVVVVLLRFVLPSRPTMLLMALVAMPAAPALGISPWVAGVVVLLAANTWVFPYQGLEYLVLRDATKGESFTDAQGIRMGLVLLAIRLIAIAASVPYWMAIGLIR